MAGGALDTIVARVESYIGEFLGTRAQLLTAKNKIDGALSIASSSGSGTAMIGDKTFSVAQLQSLSAENTELLNRNANLQTQIQSFRDQVSAVQQGATDIADTLVANPDPDYPWYDMPGTMGALPVVAVPAVYLVGAGAVLATTVYLFISNVRSHIANVAGDAGTNLIIYGGLALLAVWYAKKKGLL